MKEVIFVTSNRGKFNSAKNFLRKYGIKVTQKQLKINEPRGSLEEIVIYKSKYAFKLIKKTINSNGRWFFIHSLNGFPAMFTNFIFETIGLEGILKLVKGKN